MIPSIFWKRQNYGESKKRSDVARGWVLGGGMNRGNTENFQGCENDGYMSLYICPNPQNVQHQE